MQQPSAPRGRIIALANLKGGTGKSTLAVNIACFCALDGTPTLLLDADPQGTAAAWLDGGAAEAKPPSLAVAFRPAEGDPAEWANALYRKAAHYARIVVDMPPQLDAGFAALLRVADALLLPVTPSAIDLRATARTLKRIQAIRKERANRPACMLVPNRVDQRTAVGRTIQRSLRDLEWAVAPPVALRATHGGAFAAKQWIGAHAPGSAAYREIGAVAHELERLLAGCPPNDYRPTAPVMPTTPPVTERQPAGRRGSLLGGLLAGFRLFGRPHTG